MGPPDYRCLEMSPAPAFPTPPPNQPKFGARACIPGMHGRPAGPGVARCACVCSYNSRSCLSGRPLPLRDLSRTYTVAGRPASVKRSCPGEKPHLVGNTIKLLTYPIWAPARQRYLVSLASLTTRRPGHIIKAGPWPSSQRETPRL